MKEDVPYLRVVSERSEAEILLAELQEHVTVIGAQAMLISCAKGDVEEFLMAIMRFHDALLTCRDANAPVTVRDIISALETQPRGKDGKYDPFDSAQREIIESSVRYRGHDLLGSASGRNAALRRLFGAIEIMEDVRAENRRMSGLPRSDTTWR